MVHYNECVLVVEDDPQIKNYICYALMQEGLRSVAAATGKIALSTLVSEAVDILLLDLGLPDMDGMDLIKRVREWSEIPIIVVSARDQDKEKAAALDGGADDYLIKPFSATELMARVRVALRHLYRQGKRTNLVSQEVGGLKINFEKHLVYLDEAELHVTPMEYALLTLLFKNIGKVLTTGFLIEALWGAGYGKDTQALRALMAALRRKIEKEPAKPRYLITEIGVGYRLTDQ